MDDTAEAKAYQDVSSLISACAFISTGYCECDIHPLLIFLGVRSHHLL
jgi:hypothetical protein